MMWQKSRVTSKYYRLKHLFRFANTLPTHIHPQARFSKLDFRFYIPSVFEFPNLSSHAYSTPLSQNPGTEEFKLSPLSIYSSNIPTSRRLPSFQTHHQDLRGRNSQHAHFFVLGEAIQ